MDFVCAKCGKSVQVVDGAILRDCDCSEGVVAKMKATVTGESAVAGDDGGE